MEQLQGLFAVFGADNAIAGELKTHHQNATDSRLVVNHKKSGLRLRGLSARHWLFLLSTCNLTGKGVETDANKLLQEKFTD